MQGYRIDFILLLIVARDGCNVFSCAICYRDVVFSVEHEAGISVEIQKRYRGAVVYQVHTFIFV